MTAYDQLEIINGQGEIRFHQLNGGGITNIGRHPDNDIVVDSPVVAPFHAVLDHQHKPFRLIALNADGAIKVSGQLLQPNVPKELRNWDTIELDGHSLILMEGGGASGTPAPSIAPAPLPIPIPVAAPPTAAPPMAAPTGSPGFPQSSGSPGDLPDLDELDRLLSALPEDRSDEFIIVEPVAQNGALDPNHPSSLDFQVDVEQPATLQINVTNGGDLVGEFICEVRGIDPSWVAISPSSINLNDGERGSFSVAITAPRSPASRAKPYYFSVVVTSPNYPGRMNSIGGLYVIKPFYAYSVGDIDPRKQNISYGKRVGRSVIPITNLGNSPASFNISGEDERNAATLEFDSPEEGLKLVGQVQVKVPAEETKSVPIFVTPKKRRFVAFGGQDIQYTITVAPKEGDQPTPRSVLAQARSMPFMGPIPIILFVLLLLLLAVWVFTPRVPEFVADKTEITSGDEVILSWQAWPFVDLKLEPEIGKVEGPQGSQTVAPLEDTTYILTGETFLTWLMPQWFTATKEVRVIVDPLLPEIRLFEANTPNMLAGDEVIISWEVVRAESLILNIDGSDETIPPDQLVGSRTFVLERDTIFTLRAANRYVPEGVQQSVTVRAIVPSPTPLPEPIIQQFDVLPLSIVSGEDVTITWDVKNVSKVTIEGVEGELPPSGTVTVRPTTNTAYVLKASNGQVEKQSIVQQVIVAPQPTATPEPGAPKIDFFLATPPLVGIGSPESKNILLTWKVSGDTTAIEITGPNNAKFSGLTKTGSLSVAADKATLYVLTAFNGPTLRTSATAQIKAQNPVPKITSISPVSSSNVGGSGFVLTVNGSGFTKDSKVQWAGSNHTTVFVSEGQLTASILSEDIVKAGTFDVKVFNPSPGGGTSGGVTFTLNNPVPTLASLSPASVTKGSPSITLTVNGTNFVSGSIVRFLGADAPTTFVSSTELTAQITPGQLASAGKPVVLVFNPGPGGGTSNTLEFIVNASNPVPTINLLTAAVPGVQPSTAIAGGGNFDITVRGSNFVQGSQVAWKSEFLDTIYVSDTELKAKVAKKDPNDPDGGYFDSYYLNSTGTFIIRVKNPSPGGGLSNSVDFVVQPLTVAIDSVPPFAPPDSVGVPLNGSPSSANPRMQVTIPAAQAAVTTVTLSTNAATIMAIHPYDSLAATPCDTGTIITSVDIPIGSTTADFCIDGLSPGLAILTAALPSALGGETGTQTVAVTGDAPAIISLGVPAAINGDPAPGVGVGSGSFTLTISGQNFSVNPKAQVRFSAGATVVTVTALTATPSTLTASVPVAFLGTVQDVTVDVINTGGIPSINAGTLHVNAPTLTGISPDTKTSGQAGFTMTLTGTNFVSGSTVQFNGTNIIPNFNNSTTLLANISASDIQSYAATPYDVTVTNPGGFVTTPTQPFTLNPPAITLSVSPTSTTIGGQVTFTVSISPTQSVARTISVSGPASLGLYASDCGGALAVSIPAGNTSTTFCGIGTAVSATPPDTVTATLSGFPSVTDDATITVTPATSTIRLTRSTSATVVTGEPISFTAFVVSGGGTPTGTVTFTDTTTGTTLCSSVALTVSAPISATCNTSLTHSNITNHTIGAAFVSTNSLIASNPPITTDPPAVTVSVTTAKAATSIQSFTVSPTTIIYGQSPTVTANLEVTSPGNGTPTGNLELKESSTVLKTTALGANLDGIDISPTTLLDAVDSPHSVYANYPGDNNFATSQSLPTNVTVNKAATSVSVTSSANPVYYGVSVTLTATITNTDSTGVWPTGSVAFTADGSSITGCGSRPVSMSTSNVGTATCTFTNALNANGAGNPNYTIAANYTASPANFNNNSGTMSGSLVIDPTPVNISVSSNNNSANYGEAVTFTITVSATVGTATPTGTIILSGITNSCASASALTSGSRTCTMTVPRDVGSYNLTVNYDNTDGNFVDSNTGTTLLTQTIVAATTTTSVTSNDGNNATIFGQTFTLTAVVTNTDSTQTPTGTVTFTSSVNGNITGCVSVAASSTTSNSATYTCAIRNQLTASNAGTAHNLSATFTDAVAPINFADSTDGSPISHTVTNPTISITLSPSGSCPDSTNGSSRNLTVTITAAQSTGTTINLSSSNTAAGTVPASVTITAESTSVNFTVTKVANGTTNITGTLPAGLGGSSTNSCAITFT